MRYKCTNKNCEYRRRNRKYWTCPVKNAPLKCPYCGKELIKYKRPEEQGRAYEQHIVRLTNKTLKLDKNRGLYAVPGSGSHKNFKGDVTRFPKPVNDLLGQCKDTVPTKDEEEQWRQAVKDAIKMKQSPCLLKPFFGRDTIRVDYLWFLDLLRRFRK